jgi:AcrR family transcriptional regulator
MDETKPIPRRAPDPRLARTREHVLSGAGAVLAERGIAGFTIDEVVERTGVALSTIYRHWRSRNLLLADAIKLVAEPRSLPDTGSVRADLMEFLSWRSRHLSENWDVSLQTLPGIIEAGRRNSEIGNAVTESVGQLHDSLRTIIDRGRERNEIRYDGDPATLADLLLGALFIHAGYRGIPSTDAYIKAVIDIVLDGIAADLQRRRPDAPGAHGRHRGAGRSAQSLP